MYLLPQPMKTVWQEGNFCVRYGTEIIIGTAIPTDNNAYAYEYAKMLQEEITADTGLTLHIRHEARNTESACGSKLTRKSEAGEIVLTCECLREQCERRQAAIADESYSLQINENSVIISAGSSAGLLYGVQTLRQMLRQAGAVLPCVQIEDAPKLVARGLSYDTTRGRVPTLEELKKQADLCSFYKMNQLQLYVEHSYLFRDESEVWRSNTPLEAEEVMELDAYCRKLHIELVPALASFGHLYDVLRTKTYAPLCELENSDKQPYSLVGRMAHHTLDVSNEESFYVAARRIEEFIALFSSRYFNICGDETFDLCKGRSKALGEEKGVKRVYLDFLKKLCNFLVEKGKIPMYWGDVLLEKPKLLPEMPENAICLNWEYLPEVKEDNVKILNDAGVKNLYLCPGVQSWGHLINKHSDAYLNISLMCRNAHKFHAQGVLNTAWGDLGHIAPPEFSTIGLIYGAAFSLGDELMEEEEINRAISVLQYGDAKEEIVSLFRNLADTECVNWWFAVQYKEEHEGTWTKPQEVPVERIIFSFSHEVDDYEDFKVRMEKQLARNMELVEQLYAKVIDVPEKTRPDVCSYLLMGEGQKLLTKTGWVLYQVDKGQTRQVTEDTKALAEQLEYWLAEYQKLWRRESKESELHRIADVICWYADRLREI